MRFILHFIVCSFPLLASAGGGPFNTLVVANQNSLDSLEVAQYYQSQRGLPANHLCLISTTTNALISHSNYLAQIEQPIQDWMSDRGLEQQIHFVALSRDIPYRVQRIHGSSNSINGITSALFYGFKSYPPTPVCQLPVGTTNSYFESEIAYEKSAGFTGSTNGPLVSILSGWTKNDSLDLIDRALIADSSFPAGRARYIRSLDPFRNVRWPQYEDSDYQTRFQAYRARPLFTSGTGLINEMNVTGVSIGVAQVSPMSVNTSYEAGAYTDHLTSYGGDLFKTFSGQMSILDWLWAGASGSYGTVVEPCNYIEKFPQVRVHNWSGMGFNLAESYMMAVEVPYMGVVVGDPLTQPYAKKPLGGFTSVTNDQSVSGVFEIFWDAEAEPDIRIGEVDLYVNGEYQTQLFQAVTRSGTTFSATVGVQVVSNSIPVGLVLEEALSHVSGLMESGTTGFSFRPLPGRIEIIQQTLRSSASNIVLGMMITDPASALSITSPASCFYESEYPARMLCGLKGTVTTGDVVRAVVTRLDGILVTNTVTATTNDTAKSLVQNLLADLQSDASLTGSVGCTATDYGYNARVPFTNRGLLYLLANTTGWTGSHLRLDYDVVSSTLTNTSVDTFFNNNEAVMSGRAEFQGVLGPTSVVDSFTFDSTLLPNGPVDVQIVVKSGAAARVQHIAGVRLNVTNSSLQVLLNEPSHHQTFLLGSTVTGVASTAGGSVTGMDVFVEGHLHESAATNSISFSLDTLDYGVGWVEIQAGGSASPSNRALSEIVDIQILPNDDIDFDQLADDWEIIHFGSITNYSGADDADFDGQNNRFEYCAGTQPTNENHRFTFDAMSLTNGVLQAEYASGSGYVYRLEKAMGSITNTPALWQPVDTVTAQNVFSKFIYPLSGITTTEVYRITVGCPSLMTD